MKNAAGYHLCPLTMGGFRFLAVTGPFVWPVHSFWLRTDPFFGPLFLFWPKTVPFVKRPATNSHGTVIGPFHDLWFYKTNGLKRSRKRSLNKPRTVRSPFKPLEDRSFYGGIVWWPVKPYDDRFFTMEPFDDRSNRWKTIPLKSVPFVKGSDRSVPLTGPIVLAANRSVDLTVLDRTGPIIRTGG